MKKCSFLFCQFLLSLALFAQDKNSKAYNTGFAIGKVVGFVLIGGFVIWGIAKLFKKK